MWQVATFDPYNMNICSFDLARYSYQEPEFFTHDNKTACFESVLLYIKLRWFFLNFKSIFKTFNLTWILGSNEFEFVKKGVENIINAVYNFFLKKHNTYFWLCSVLAIAESASAVSMTSQSLTPCALQQWDWRNAVMGIVDIDSVLPLAALTWLSATNRSTKIN